MARHKKKSTSEPYLVIPRRTIRSKEYNQLSPHARCIYILLCTEWKRDGKNQAFMFTYKQMSEIIQFDDRRISACIKELTEAGFMEKDNYGGLLRNPNTYSLNEDWLLIKNNGRGINN